MSADAYLLESASMFNKVSITKFSYYSENAFISGIPTP